MYRIVGRDPEIKLLERALESDRPELIAIYGRRRVGKTFLIREIYKKHIQFEFSGIHNGPISDQLENFHNNLLLKTSKFDRPSSWLAAFFQLERYIRGLRSQKKKVIFIDEFPWLATRKSRFLMAFENFWNGFASTRRDLVVVICGSAASYMVNQVIKNRGGLHNRITHRIRLRSFDLYQTSLFLKSRNISYSKYDTLQIYMALGGVPHYLEQIQKGESVVQALDRLCFLEDAPLRLEFKEIFISLFENPDNHDAILRVLGNTRSGLTRSSISKKSRIPTGGRLTKTLNELEVSGFIDRSMTFRNRKKDSLYRLSDEYSLFFLKFIEKNTSWETGSWTKKFNSQSYRVWLGFSFETICLKHIRQIKAALGISAIFSENYSFIDKISEKGSQIDLLLDRADNVINLCEMKFHKGPVTISKSEAEVIRNKIESFRAASNSRKIIFFTMVTTFGLTKNQYSLELVQNEVDMDCFFKP